MFLHASQLWLNNYHLYIFRPWIEGETSPVLWKYEHFPKWNFYELNVSEPELHQLHFLKMSIYILNKNWEILWNIYIGNIKNDPFSWVIYFLTYNQVQE